jgi:OFA family oxalate/formate antiporter-like MFS transporter
MFMVAGLLQDRIGPRTVATIGGLLFSLGLFLASFTTSLGMLYATWGFMVGAGLGFGYLAPITVGSKWFPDQRGLVNGLAIGIFAAGSGIFGPIAGVLVERVGWRTTFQLMAGLFFVFTMVGAYLLKNPPDGYTVPAAPSASARRPRMYPDIPTSEVLKLPMFYVLWFAYALGTTAGTMVISQLVPFARLAGLSAREAGFAITVGAVGSAFGRFFSGWISDHLGRLSTLRTMIVLSMIATPLLYIERSSGVVLFYALLFIVYYCYGTQLSVYTALAGDFYGPKYLATNYGMLLLAWGFAGVLGPVIGSRVFAATGSYQYAFFGSAVLAAAALVNLTIVRPPQSVAAPQPSSVNVRA